MLQALCSRLLAGGLASCCRTLALCALLVLCAPTSQARGAPADWRRDAPLGAHAMLYLDAPYSFKRSMFQESADLGASTIRVDLALTAVFIADGTEQWQQVDEVMALAREYRLRPVGVLLATPLSITACPAEAHSYTCPRRVPGRPRVPGLLSVSRAPGPPDRRGDEGVRHAAGQPGRPVRIRGRGRRQRQRPADRQPAGGAQPAFLGLSPTAPRHCGAPRW